VTFSPGKPVRIVGGMPNTITDSAQTYAVAPKGDRR
jgi:hypothetical protein